MTLASLRKEARRARYLARISRGDGTKTKKQRTAYAREADVMRKELGGAAHEPSVTATMGVTL